MQDHDRLREASRAVDAFGSIVENGAKRSDRRVVGDARLVATRPVAVIGQRGQKSLDSARPKRGLNQFYSVACRLHSLQFFIVLPNSVCTTSDKQPQPLRKSFSSLACWGATMNKGLLLAATILSLTGSAFAADLPTTKSAPPVPTPPPVYNWSGFYLGVNAGVGFWDSGHVTINDPVLGPQRLRADSNTAFVGGGQAGYNIQTGQTVFGVETDIQGVSGGSSFNWGRYGASFGPSDSGNTGYLGTVRGRVGYAIDRTLIYATGGFAYGELNNGPFTNNTQTGYTVGGGVEFAFISNWTVRLEGLFVSLDNGTRTRTLVNAGVPYPVTASGGNDGGLVRVGLNYKF